MSQPGWFRKAWFWAPPILWALAMHISSHFLISNGTPSWASMNDKLLHAIYFGGFALLLFRAAAGTTRLPLLWIALGVFMITVLYGGLDEWTQTFTRQRTADPRDWLMDVAGASLVFPTALALLGWRRRRPQPALES